MLRSFRRRERPLWQVVAAIAVPGLGSYLLQKRVIGSHPVRAFDLGLLLRSGLPGRLTETFREEFTQLVRPAWPAIAALAFLVAFARKEVAMRRILALTALLLGTYLILPALCPFGPGWLVHWTLTRIIPALAPLLAAGIGVGWSASLNARDS
jgi:drug/metabolite transporter (DMT)-like permease